jgi:hypothetical protein
MSSSTAMKKHKVNFVVTSWTNARSNFLFFYEYYCPISLPSKKLYPCFTLTLF